MQIFMLHVYYAAINIEPETKYANISDTLVVNFYCKATGFRTDWYIDNVNFPQEVYKSENSTLDGYNFIEIKEVGVGMDDIIHYMYLNVPATIRYNQITVQCRVFPSTSSKPVLSDPVMLILQGKSIHPFIHIHTQYYNWL